MNKEQIKDKIILTVKNAIADNADIDVDTDTVTTDCNGVDHIAEQVAKELYNAFKPIDKEPIGALGKRGLTGKEEQIKEMADIIKAGYKEWLDVTGVIPEGTTYYAECLGESEDCAELLYNAGYRKTFTSDFASDTQKAYKEGYIKGAIDRDIEIAELKAENKRLTEELRQVLLSIDTVKEMNTMCNIDEQRKQAVKEFAEKLKMKTHNYYPSIDSYCISKKAVLISEIDELLKEYEQ